MFGRFPSNPDGLSFGSVLSVSSFLFLLLNPHLTARIVGFPFLPFEVRFFSWFFP